MANVYGIPEDTSPEARRTDWARFLAALHAVVGTGPWAAPEVITRSLVKPADLPAVVRELVALGRTEDAVTSFSGKVSAWNGRDVHGWKAEPFHVRHPRTWYISAVGVTPPEPPLALDGSHPPQLRSAAATSGPALGTVVPSPDEVLAARSAAGAWTKATLAEWGIPWPPPKGWRRELERRWRQHDRD